MCGTIRINDVGDQKDGIMNSRVKLLRLALFFGASRGSLTSFFLPKKIAAEQGGEVRNPRFGLRGLSFSHIFT